MPTTASDIRIGRPMAPLRPQVDAHPLRTDASDSALLQRARSGDDGAFAILYVRHRGDIDRLAVALVGRGEAEDVSAETFVRVFEQIRGGRGPVDSFASYSRTVVRSIAADYFRSAARRAIPTGDVEGTLVELGRPVGELDPGIEAIADRSIVRQAFATLPRRWQAVLWCTSVQGLAPRSIATPLASNPNAVASVAKRAKAGLRTAYLAAHVNPRAPAHCRAFLLEVARSLRTVGSSCSSRSSHARRCPQCRRGASEIGEVNAMLP